MSETPEMVERVARAIMAAIHEDEVFIGSDRDLSASIAVDGWIDFLALARAAIEAMREPTEAMLWEGPVEPYMDAYVWQRMIDAALTAAKPTSSTA